MLKVRKIIFIAIFTIIGVLGSNMLHAITEIWYIGLLILDYKKYSFGLSWVQLYLIHNILSFLFLIFGAIIGCFMGMFFWKTIFGRIRKNRFYRTTKYLS